MVSMESNQDRHYFSRRVTVADGRVKSESGSIDTEMRMPVELGGEPDATGVDPLEATAASAAMCFAAEIYFRAVALKLAPTDVRVIGTCDLKSDRSDGYGHDYTIDLAVTMGGLDRDQAMALLQAAEAECPICIRYKGGCRVHLDESPASSR